MEPRRIPITEPEALPPPASQDAPVNRYAFVIHPLGVEYINRHFRWTRLLPDSLVETFAARMPPMFISRIKGGRSPSTGQRIEGLLFSIGATPRQIMGRAERFTYAQLNRIARTAERMGASIMGLGAFTKVVGDAGITVAREANIPVTSGNSLTVVATLESAKQAMKKMGNEDLTRGRVMIVGATGAIGSVCSRLVAQATRDVVLVSIEPDRLEALQRTIESETPGARVVTALTSDDLIGDCDVIITATSAFAQRILDISKCKPGAVICDVALPPDITSDEAAVRPDVLAIESGEVVIPGPVDFGYNIGLPPGTAYACLAEAALLAMEGRFECYTLGRNIDMHRVKEMYRLFKKHGFQIAGLRSFGRFVTDDELAGKRALAERYRNDPELFARVRAEAAEKLAKIPAKSKGVPPQPQASLPARWIAAGAGAAALAALLAARKRAARALHHGAK